MMGDREHGIRSWGMAPEQDGFGGSTSKRLLRLPASMAAGIMSRAGRLTAEDITPGRAESDRVIFEPVYFKAGGAEEAR